MTMLYENNNDNMKDYHNLFPVPPIPFIVLDSIFRS